MRAGGLFGGGDGSDRRGAGPAAGRVVEQMQWAGESHLDHLGLEEIGYLKMVYGVVAEMVASPLVAGRSLPAVAGCKRYPSVFVLYGLDVACARPITSAGVLPVVVVVAVVAAAAARESSHCTPLAFMMRLLGPLRPLSRHRCMHTCILHRPAPNTRANRLHTLPGPCAFPSSMIPSCSFLSVILPPLASPRGSTSFKSDRCKTFCDRSARGP